MSIEIYNDTAYIKVIDTRTMVESHFYKPGIVIQSITDPTNPSFFIKTDSYTGFYKYSDVSVPDKPNLDSLVAQLKTWILQKNLYETIYGETPTTIFQLKTMYDKSDMYIDEIANDVVPYPIGGSVVTPAADVESTHLPATREVSMYAPSNITPGEGGRMVRQSKSYVACPTDRFVVGMMTGTLLDPNSFVGNYVAVKDGAAMDSTDGSVYRIGMFDDPDDITLGANAGNGVFVEYWYDLDRDDYNVGSSNENPHAVDKLAGLSGGEKTAYQISYKSTKLWIGHRTTLGGTMVERRVPQMDWNRDVMMNSEGSSVELDPSARNTFVFRWSCVPGMNVLVGVMNHGMVNWLHEFDTGDENGLCFGASTLPMRWELDNRNGTADANMIQGRGIASCDGTYTIPGRVYTFDTHMDLLTLTNQTPVPVLSIRLSANKSRGRIYPKRLSLLNVSAAGTIKYELRLNASLTGADFAAAENYSFDNSGRTGSLKLSKQGSFAQVDTEASAVSGGFTVVSGFLHDNVSREVGIDFSELPIVSSIDGTSDVLTLVCTYVVGVATVGASLSWTEYD